MLLNIKLLIFSLCYIQCEGYIEKVSASGCENCTLRLTCRGLDTIIAIIDAQFFPNNISKQTLDFNSNSSFIRFQTRKSLVHRCSGVNHCSFILTKDSPGAEALGLGNLTVNYFCVAVPKLTKHCNKIISSSNSISQEILEGFVHNPGYPRFYLGNEICHWVIKALPLQRIKVTILDISLLGSDSENCSDIFLIKESNHVLFSSCLRDESPYELLSTANEIEIFITPSLKEQFIPRRGILFSYTTVGCATPSTPKNANFIKRNQSAAEFGCHFDFAFIDTHLRTKYIKCIGNKWNEDIPLPDCDNVTVIEAQTVNLITSDIYITDNKMTEKTSLQEIIVPTVIIVLLLILNTVVLFMIYKYKKRKESEFYEEELGTLSINGEKQPTNARA